LFIKKIFISHSAAILPLHFTCLDIKHEKSDVSTGYIGAIKNLKINFLPKVNSTISTEVIIENEILGVTIISGQVKCNGNIAAECEMKIFLINNQE